MAKSTCSIEDCDRPSNCRGWCKKHYHRWLMTGTVELRPKPPPRQCLEAGCERLAVSRGRCGACCQRWRRVRSDGQRCTIEDCNRPQYGRGWCALHYDRWRSNGDPLVVQVIIGDDETRFWSYVDRRGPTECWAWTGTLSHEGYGVFQVGRVQVRAHRHAYEQLVGPIPDGYTLDHLCHTRDRSCFRASKCPHRRCVNPAHAEPVTNEENARRGHSATKDRCPRDHPYEVVSNGAKRCRICHRDRMRESRARLKAESASRLDDAGPSTVAS